MGQIPSSLKFETEATEGGIKILEKIIAENFSDLMKSVYPLSKNLKNQS